MTKINPNNEPIVSRQVEQTKFSPTFAPSSIMPDSYASSNQKPEELSEELGLAIKSNDSAKIIKSLEILIQKADSRYIGRVATSFAKDNNASLAYTLLNLQVIKDNPELYQRIKALCQFQTNGYNDFLATDLFDALNSSSKEKTAKLINNITPVNVRNVAFFYDKIASQTGEIAATKADKENMTKPGIIGFLEDFFSIRRYPMVKENAEHPEKLIQGIMNQIEIPIKDRAIFLKKVLNCYIENAKSNNISKSKINAFYNKIFVEKSKKWDETVFEHVTSYPNNNRAQSTYEIECALTELFE